MLLCVYLCHTLMQLVQGLFPACYYTTTGCCTHAEYSVAVTGVGINRAAGVLLRSGTRCDAQLLHGSSAPQCCCRQLPLRFVHVLCFHVCSHLCRFPAATFRAPLWSTSSFLLEPPLTSPFAGMLCCMRTRTDLSTACF